MNRIKPLSEKRRNQVQKYSRIRKEWLADKECALSAYSFAPCEGILTVHHKKGRSGNLLNDTEYWLPVCMNHHQYIENNPKEAYEKGWKILRSISGGTKLKQ